MKRYMVAVLGVMALMAVLVVAAVSTASGETAGVSATATNNAKITISVNDSGADFGTNLDPTGPASDSADGVTAHTSAGVGAFYEWKTGGMSVTVSSNKLWDGSVTASTSTGTSASMTIASGVLKRTATDPTSYSDCNSATSLATSAVSNNWKDDIAKGVNSYTEYYCLRVAWTDDPGTFISTVTYTVTQP
ncbi:MAG: hypothetical protein HYY00_05555 [Chloroflexi bacterium]|nr:hypothetical protein [Chloroflexota bacterium]